MQTLKSCVGIMLIMVLTSCTALHAPVRPGAVNQFDSQAFGVLGGAAASIEQLQKDCPSGPASPCPQAEKDAINKIIAVYQSAKVALGKYHDSVKAGITTDHGPLDAALSQVSAALNAYAALKAKK